ncbi:MAG TPA: RsmG family class I SAM-dependent methyltransferase, partial [Polyangiaceae bacterium]|nr:RsmG family class I SAM-dependent methyltransferase [Polyangiaceae bacterium]
IGAGAGAPGLVLALLAPELTLTLVEPRQKRVAFLRTALSTLGRSDVRVERRRSQDLASKSAHIAVARATLPPSEWLPEGARLATQGVWVLLAREQPPVLAGYAPDREVEYVWPLAGAARRAVRYVQQS